MSELGSGRPSPRTQDPAGVPRARSEDIARRRKVYVIQMSIRVVCIATLPFLPFVPYFQRWWMLLPLAGAILLPYTAVLMANDQRVDEQVEGEFDHEDAPLALTAAPSTDTPAANGHRAPTTLSVDADGTVHTVEGAPVVDDEDPSSDPRSDR